MGKKIGEMHPGWRRLRFVRRIYYTDQNYHSCFLHPVATLQPETREMEHLLEISKERIQFSDPATTFEPCEHDEKVREIIVFE
jgi:hypothetical protein